MSLAVPAQITHEQRTAVYVSIIQTRMPGPLTEFVVARMRNAAPGEREMAALNAALVELGWTQ